MNDWAAAVGLLTRFRVASTDSSGTVPQPWFAVVGAALGLAAWLLMSLCIWFGGPRAGAVLAAVAVLALEGWVTAGRRYGAAIRLLESIPDGAGGAETGAYVRLAAFQGLIVMKLLCFGVLAAMDRGAWLLVVGAVSAAAVAPRVGPSHSQHESAGSEVWRMWGQWIVACAIAAVAGRLAGALLAGLFSLLVAGLLPNVLEPLLGAESRQPGSLAWLSLAETLALVVLGIGTLAVLAG